MNTALAGNDCDAGQAGWRRAIFIACVLALPCAGCGTTKSFTATEQLLVSDAVDSTVAKIDFRPLTGRKVFLDNAYVPSQKGVPNPNPQFVHTEYVASSLRQQMLAAGVYLCEKREDAEIVVEARLGALGFDGHTMTYGIPASSSLSSAASTLSGTPMIPLLPELSFAKKEAKQGAAKIALFAYERVSLQPVWQSGIAKSSSSARDTWVLGMGPLQYGTIYEGTRFGGRIMRGPVSRLVHEDDEPEQLVDYKRSQVFNVLNQSESSESATVNNPPAGGASVTPAGASAAPGAAPGATPASATAPATPPAASPLAVPTPPPAGPPAPPPAAVSKEPAKLHLDDKAAK